MILKKRSVFFQFKMRHIIHKHNRMRISHRHTGHAPLLVIHNNRFIHNAIPICHNRNLIRCQNRLPHIHTDKRHFIILNRQLQCFHSSARLHRNFSLIGQLMVIHVFCHTTDTVSAHLRLRSICIIDSHPKICNVRWSDCDQSIGPDTKMPITDCNRYFRRILYLFLKQIHIHIIVATAMHLRKLHTFSS